MSKFLASFLVVITLAVIFHTSEVKSVASEGEVAAENVVPEEASAAAAPTAHYGLEEEILKNISKNPFQDRIRPNGTTHVKVNLYVRDAQMKAGGISKVSTDPYFPWTLELTFRQMWNDPRLAYTVDPNTHSEKYFPLNSLHGIWKPDLFFPSAENGFFHEVMTSNQLVWLQPNGDVLYSVRISLSLPCRQQAAPRRFGHGIGTPVVCPLRIASYGYTTDKLLLEWDKALPIQIRTGLQTEAPQYCTLDQAVANATTHSATRTGNYSTITAEFQFLC